MLSNYISIAFISLGLFSIFSSVVGVLRFSDFYNKLHAASIADSFGIPLCLIGLMFQATNTVVIFKLSFIIIFIWLLGPVSTNALATAAWHKNSLK